MRALPEIFEVNNEEDVKRLEDIALLVLKKYLDLYYKKFPRHFETKNLRYVKFQQLPLPFISEEQQGYIVQIDKREKDLIERIRNLVRRFDELIKEDERTLPRVYFDGSLYVLLLLQSNKIDKKTPNHW